eukprot:gene10403-8351_t
MDRLPKAVAVAAMNSIQAKFPILFEMDRLPKAVAVAAMNSIQAKFPVRLGFVEWS